MAENKKDFSRFHTMPVEEWRTRGGEDYIRYLKKSKTNNVKLEEEEKRDLARLEEYEKSAPSEELNFDESAIDWERLKTPYDVAFYLCFPPFLLSNANKNIQNYVLSEYKKKSISIIAKEANEKLGKGKTGDKKGENKGSENSQSKEEENKQDKKPTLWVRLGKFVLGNSAEHKNEMMERGMDPVRDIKLSKNTERKIEDKVNELLEEDARGEHGGVELGDE